MLEQQKEKSLRRSVGVTTSYLSPADVDMLNVMLIIKDERTEGFCYGLPQSYRIYSACGISEKHDHFGIAT